MGSPTYEDCKVQEVIDKAMRGAASPGRGTNDQVKMAYSDVYGQRLKNYEDEILAAAEHYLYARQEVGIGGNPTYAKLLAFIPAYETVKVLPRVRAGLVLLNKLLGDPEPRVSKPTLLAIRWGKWGAYDGLADYKANPDNAPDD